MSCDHLKGGPPQSWNPTERFATPSGVACFPSGSGTAYAHGGISLQECLTPVLEVSGGSASTPAAAITEVRWKGMRCTLEVSGASAGVMADLRRGGPVGPSVATSLKAIDEGGARLLVEDDELMGKAVIAVLVGPDSRIIVQRPTKVGG